MKCSIITWDASFRESSHTLRFFENQSETDFDLHWVDFYEPTEVVATEILNKPNFHMYGLKNSTNTNWNLGHCMNFGAQVADSELLFFVDGDIAVESDFVARALSCYNFTSEGPAVYLHRLDEPLTHASEKSTSDINHLKKYSRVINAANFAACLIIHKSLFNVVGGFETHHVFNGPGIIATDLYLRLKNYGVPIIWDSNLKTYHPAHRNTGTPSKTTSQKKLHNLRQDFPWIIPYAGIEQSWVVHNRGLLGSTKSSTAEIESLIIDLPSKAKRALKRKPLFKTK